MKKLTKKKVQQIVIGFMGFTALMAAPNLETSTGKKCGGSDRWAVKVLADVEANNIKFNAPIETTIPTLTTLKTDTLDIGRDTRRTALETKVYSIKNCRIKEIIKEEDDDLHLVITDSRGNELIGEIPYFNCQDAMQSGFSDLYKNARNNILINKLNLTKQRFDITGVAFVDLTHGTPQHGVADNNIELHPILTLNPLIK